MLIAKSVGSGNRFIYLWTSAAVAKMAKPHLSSTDKKLHFQPFQSFFV